MENNGMTLTKFNASMAATAETVQSLRPWSDQKILHFQSKSYTFKINFRSNNCMVDVFLN